MTVTKKIQINELKPQPPSLLEQEIIRIVDKAIRNSQVQLAADDVKLIAKEIMPDLDKLVSDKIKKHFYEIGKFIVDRFDTGR